MPRRGRSSSITDRSASQHLAAVFFEQLTGVELIHVPYRNITQYGPDLIAGTVQLGFQ